MAKIPKRVAERFRRELPRFQRVLQNAKDRDVNEADTVMIVGDVLAGIFGFDKYEEITAEYAIRGVYCDLAVTIDGKVCYLIEVKAVGLALKENHLRQAVNYGAAQGIPWVVLTNGLQWEIHRIRFEQPVDVELVCAFDLLELNGRREADQAQLYLLCKEGLAKAAIEEYHEHLQTVNRFVLGAVLQSDPMIDVFRRELRRITPGLKVTKDEIAALLEDTLKRDVLEGEPAKRARALVAKAAKRALRRTARSRSEEPTSIAAGDTTQESS